MSFSPELSLVTIIFLIAFFCQRQRIRSLELNANFTPIHIEIKPNWRLILKDYFDISEDLLEQIATDFSRAHDKYFKEVSETFPSLKRCEDAIDLNPSKDYLPQAIRLYGSLQFTVLSSRPSIVFNQLNNTFSHNIGLFEPIKVLEKVSDKFSLFDDFPYIYICGGNKGYELKLTKPTTGWEKLVATIPYTFVYADTISYSAKRANNASKILKEFGWEYEQSGGGEIDYFEIRHKYLTVEKIS